jgi:hypothetical protein
MVLKKPRQKGKIAPPALPFLVTPQHPKLLSIKYAGTLVPAGSYQGAPLGKVSI